MDTKKAARIGRLVVRRASERSMLILSDLYCLFSPTRNRIAEFSDILVITPPGRKAVRSPHPFVRNFTVNPPWVNQFKRPRNRVSSGPITGVVIPQIHTGSDARDDDEIPRPSKPLECK